MSLEYDGVQPYVDYTVSDMTGPDGTPDGVNDTFDVSRMYLAGIAQMGPGATLPEYFHADQIGSTRGISDQFSVVSSRWTYSAFGEVLETTGTPDTRYQYAGEHGYQSGLIDDWALMQVGARWYDPTTGRFVQRDPIGIRGGLNMYAYVASSPLHAVDPSGLYPQGGLEMQAEYRGWREAGKTVDETTGLMAGAHRTKGRGDGYVDSIQSEQQAKDLANASALGIIFVAWCGGPLTGVIGSGVVAGAYVYDYVVRY